MDIGVNHIRILQLKEYIACVNLLRNLSLPETQNSFRQAKIIQLYCVTVYTFDYAYVHVFPFLSLFIICLRILVCVCMSVCLCVCG